MINSRRPGSVLVTGAARGIGRATAELFLAHGWRVGMYDVDGAAVAGCGRRAPPAVHGTLDVRDDGAVADGAARVLRRRRARRAGQQRRRARLRPLRRHGPRRAPADGRRERDRRLPRCGRRHEYLERSAAGCCSTSARRRRSTGSRRWRPTGRRRRRSSPSPRRSTWSGGPAGDPGAQPAAAVRRHGDGVARRAGRGQRRAPRRAAHRRGRRRRGLARGARAAGPFRGPHRPVGRQARLLAAASAVTPGWANRLIVARLSG